MRFLCFLSDGAFCPQDALNARMGGLLGDFQRCFEGTIPYNSHGQHVWPFNEGILRSLNLGLCSAPLCHSAPRD